MPKCNAHWILALTFTGKKEESTVIHKLSLTQYSNIYSAIN